MTHKVAVEKTIKMWLWLAEHPQNTKEDYLAALLPDQEDWPQENCFLCEAFNKGYGKCGFVKEKLRFATGCPLDTCALNCDCGENSPWTGWRKGWNNMEKTKQAMRIVHACRRWLHKHNKEVNNNG